MHSCLLMALAALAEATAVATASCQESASSEWAASSKRAPPELRVEFYSNGRAGAHACPLAGLQAPGRDFAVCPSEGMQAGGRDSAACPRAGMHAGPRHPVLLQPTLVQRLCGSGGSGGHQARATALSLVLLWPVLVKAGEGFHNL